jgi:hypothetical protein
MPNIKISDLHSTGSELFSDSESYMNELSDLSDVELDVINGGSIVSRIVTRIGAELSKRTITFRCTHPCTPACPG